MPNRQRTSNQKHNRMKTIACWNLKEIKDGNLIVPTVEGNINEYDLQMIVNKHFGAKPPRWSHTVYLGGEYNLDDDIEWLRIESDSESVVLEIWKIVKSLCLSPEELAIKNIIE